MLKPAEMRELRIAVLEEDIDSVIKRIEAFGNVHLVDVKEILEEWEDLVEPLKDTKRAMEYSDLRGRIERIIAVLRPSAKKSIRERLFKEEKVERVQVEEDKLGELSEEFEGIEKVTTELVEWRDRLREDLTNTKELSGVLKILEDFELDLDLVGEQDFVSVYAGKLPGTQLEGLKSDVDSVTGENHVIASKEILRGKEESEYFVVVAVLKKDKEEVENTLRTVDFEAWQRPADIPAKIKEAIEEVEARIDKLEGEIKDREGKIEEIRRERFNDLLVLRELVQIEETRANERDLLGKSARVRVIEGWAPKEEVEKVIEGIREETEGCCEVEVKAPKRDDVRVPSLIKIPRILKPFSSVVKIYGHPQYGDIDPTLITAIIFPIFFGIMFPDMGHGLILTLFGLGLIFSFKGLSKGIREWGIILTLCGICAMIAGALFGEFFGFSEFANKIVVANTGVAIPDWLIFDALWLEPIHVPAYVFVLTMLVGAVHMGLGVLLSVANNLSNRNMLRAVLEIIKLWCLFGALYVLLLIFGFYFTEFIEGDFQTLAFRATIFIVLPTVLLFISCVVTELRGEGEIGGNPGEKKSLGDYIFISFYGLIDAVLENFFRYISNVVSYGRLLALALCHGALMQIFILIAYMALDISAVISAVVFLTGSVIVILFEVLIVTIQVLRLHFYEWFTKFFEGGGIEFTPFKSSRTYTR